MYPLLLIAALLLGAPASDPGPQTLDEPALWARAAALEGEGAYAEAERVFSPLTERYPQDFAIQLQAAWLAFLAQDYARAESRYLVAIELSQGAAEARSGLAWTHLRLGRARQAQREFTALLVDHPGLASAEAGLAELRRRRFVISPNGFGVAHVYGNHPTLSWALGLSVAAPMVIAEHLLFAPNYRFTRFLPPPTASDRGQGMMSGRDDVVAFDQHQATFGLGGVWRRAGFLAQYAYFHDGSVVQDHAHVAGLSLRYSPWGDIVVDGSAAGFRSGWVGRIAPHWRAPATRWLDLQPGLALQFIDRALLPSGSASVIVHGRRGALVLGGKGGLEERPVLLDVPAIFAFDGRITWGAWATGDLRLPRGLHLHAAYETHSLRAADDNGDVALAQVHYISLGLSWRSAEAFASP